MNLPSCVQPVSSRSRSKVFAMYHVPCRLQLLRFDANIQPIPAKGSAALEVFMEGPVMLGICPHGDATPVAMGLACPPGVGGNCPMPGCMPAMGEMPIGIALAIGVILAMGDA